MSKGTTALEPNTIKDPTPTKKEKAMKTTKTTKTDKATKTSRKDRDDKALAKATVLDHLEKRGEEVAAKKNLKHDEDTTKKAIQSITEEDLNIDCSNAEAVEKLRAKLAKLREAVAKEATEMKASDLPVATVLPSKDKTEKMTKKERRAARRKARLEAKTPKEEKQEKNKEDEDEGDEEKTSKKNRREEKASKKDGPVVTLADLAKELKVEGKDIRKWARKNLEHDEGARWEWTPGHKDLDKIRKHFKKAK